MAGFVQKRSITFALVFAFLLSCNPKAPILETISTQDQTANWPTEGWRSSTPEEQSMDSVILAEMIKTIQNQAYEIDSVTVIRNGIMVVDATRYPFETDSKHIIHSCTKSIVSALVGIAIYQGFIEGTHQSILSFFPDRKVENLNTYKESMNLEHLLTMSTGWDCRDSYLYRWKGLEEMMGRKDWIQHMLELPMVNTPGERFEYCNGASFLLSAIIQETTGKSALDFARENLFSPLGITDVIWPTNPQGINIGWGELRMKPHDMAKIGYLYLMGGQWDDQTIVPASWIKESTREHISATLEDGYGYQWWTDDSGYYLALGYAGQFIFVLPEKAMVVIFTSDLSEEDFYVPQTLLSDFIIPAAESNEPLPRNPQGTSALESIIKDLSKP